MNKGAKTVQTINNNEICNMHFLSIITLPKTISCFNKNKAASAGEL